MIKSIYIYIIIPNQPITHEVLLKEWKKDTKEYNLSQLIYRLQIQYNSISLYNPPPCLFNRARQIWIQFIFINIHNIIAERDKVDVASNSDGWRNTIKYLTWKVRAKTNAGDFLLLFSRSLWIQHNFEMNDYLFYCCQRLLNKGGHFFLWCICQNHFNTLAKRVQSSIPW